MSRVRDRSHLSHRSVEQSPFDVRPIGQRGPEKPGELAADRGDHVLFRLAPPGELTIAVMEAVLRLPDLLTDRLRLPLLPPAQGVARNGRWR